MKNVSVRLLFFKVRQSSFIAASSLMSVWSLVLSNLRVNGGFWLQMCIFLTLLSVELSQLQQSDTWADTISFPDRADWNFIHSGLCDWGHLVDKKPRHSKHYRRLIVLIARRTNSLRRSARESMNVWICWFVVTLHFCFVWKNMHENEQFIHHLQKLSIWAQCFL